MNKNLEETLKRLMAEIAEAHSAEPSPEGREQLAELRRRQEAWDRLTPEEKAAAEKKRVFAEHIEGWRKRGLTPRYEQADWDNWRAETPEQRKALETIRGYRWDKSLVLTGAKGTGKTHLLMCLLKEGAAYRILADIFREVRTDFAREQDVIDRLGSIPKLVIDEMGTQKASDFEANLLFAIIDKRWNNRLNTVFATNLTRSEFEQLYGEGTIDRIQPEYVMFGGKDWGSYRPKEARSEGRGGNQPLKSGGQ